MPIWKMPIDVNNRHATYPEIRDRHVVACGWSELGDLRCLYQACRAGRLAWKQVLDLLINLPGGAGDGARFEHSFKRLLCDITVGDIVIAYVGVNPVGICQICDCVTYLYDNGHDDINYEYAHCLFGVEWVDWVDFTAFVDGHGGPNVHPGNALVPGIVLNHVHVPEIEQEWAAYCAAHMPVGPCSQEILNRCQELTAAAQNDCAAQLSYWRSIPMYREIEAALNLKNQIILYGPPGTGKTYLAKQFVLRHWSLTDDRYRVVQFHPAYNYEDFVRGVQVKTVNGQVQYDTVHRVFSEMCRNASADPTNNHVLIIDEINRANLAAVLGELIYGLEYRGDPVRTPYAIDGSFDLVVPKNLYIIGTMNTADRSIGHIDYAVRRRFAFFPMLPNRNVIDQVVAPTGGLQQSALTLFEGVTALFQGNGTLARDFFPDDVQPGHTYFLAENLDQLLDNFVYQVLPLLHEYVKDGVLLASATLFGVNLANPITPTTAREAIRQYLPGPQVRPQLPQGREPVEAPVLPEPVDGEDPEPLAVEA